MKKLLLLITILALAFACTKPIDTEDLPIVDPTTITKAPNHEYRTYVLKPVKISKSLVDDAPVLKMPNINIGDTVQYIKFRSFYSEDQAQSNVYEIEAFSNGENIAIDQPIVASSTNYSPVTSMNDDNDGEIRHINDGNVLSRWSSDRFIDIDNDHPILYLDTIRGNSINGANKAFIIMNFTQKYKIDSIRLFLYQTGFGADTTNWQKHKQTFGLYISRDLVKWDSIGGGVKVNQLTF